jgi:hypothetical protein
MFAAILSLLAMPVTDLSKLRGVQFRPFSKFAFYIFVANFLILMQLGAKHVESPFIEFGQISTILYFAHFFVIVPIVSIIENTLAEVSVKSESIIELKDFLIIPFPLISIFPMLKRKNHSTSKSTVYNSDIDVELKDSQHARIM